MFFKTAQKQPENRQHGFQAAFLDLPEVAFQAACDAV